jgi:polyisoprenoid-binding protein YceI
MNRFSLSVLLPLLAVAVGGGSSTSTAAAAGPVAAAAGSPAATPAKATPATAAAAPAAAKPAAAAAGAGPAYNADPARSTLTFTGTQAGAAFKGVFKKFSASVQLDPAAPGAGRIEVRIDMNSVDTQDGERDGNIKGADFFDVAKNPSATYLTRGITKTAKGFAATGTLTLRGVSRDVPLEFQFVKTAAGASLTGSAALKRLDFGVGQGEWKSTEWVGNDVKVEFSLDLKPAP